MNTTFDNIPFYIKFSIFFVGILAFGFLSYLGQDIIMPIFFALLIAILLDPMVSFFQRLKLPRTVAITLALTVGILFLSGLIYFFMVQLSLFNESLPMFKEKFNIVLDQSKNWVSSEFNISMNAIDTQIDNWSKSLFEGTGAVIGYTVMTLTELIVVWLLIPVYAYLFLYYQKLFLGFIEQVSEKENQKTIKEVMTEGNKMIQSYLVGLVLEIIIMSVLNSVGLLILGIEYAILLGIIGALLNVIPYIGGVVSTALPMLVAIVTQDSFISPLLVLGVYLLIQFIDNNFIIPLVVASRVKINALVSIIVVLIFGALFGISGMFIAIPLTAIVKIIFDRIEPMKPYGLLIGIEIPVNTKFINSFTERRKIKIKDEGKEIK
ncbi:MAG: AI-2E family transporter [Ignavibacteria bacterium]|nr:AI-2E family transporter [Ignavibacteria bacterium]